MPSQENNTNQKTDTMNSSEDNNAPRLRTFQGDMANTLEKNKVSITTVLNAEEKRRQERGEVAETGQELQTKEILKKRKKQILIWGGVLLILGFFLIWLAFFLRTPEGSNIINQTNTITTTSLIATDQKHTITLSKNTHEELIRNILSRRKAVSLPLGKVEELKFVKNDNSPLQSSDLFSIISPTLPKSFIRLLEPNYFFGLVQTGYRDTFLIAQTKSFNAAWSGLLDWENTMLTDLGESMIRLDTPAYKAVTKQGPPVTLGFNNELYENRDVRILRDTSENVVLLYSLIDRTTIIIANSQLAFKEALDRLRARSSIR